MSNTITAEDARRIMSTGEENSWLDSYNEAIREAAIKGETSVVVS